MKRLALVLPLVLVACEGRSPTEPKPLPAPTPIYVEVPVAPYAVNVSGIVQSGISPVAGASLSFSPPDGYFTFTIFAGKDGTWRSQLPAGSYMVTVAAAGYQTLITVATISRTQAWLPFFLSPIGGK